MPSLHRLLSPMLGPECLVRGLAGGLETKVNNAAAISELGAPPQEGGGGVGGFVGGQGGVGGGFEIEVVNADVCGVDKVLLAVVSAIAPRLG